MSSNYGILGYPSNWSLTKAGIASIPPDYFLPAVRQGFRLTRKNIKRDVDTAMPIDPTQPIVRWKIPNNSATILDFRRAVVYVTFSAAVNAPATVAPSNLAWNIFDRCRLEQAGNYVEDRRYFNLQETLLYTLQTHIQQQLTTGVELYGAGSLTTRQGRSVGFKYALPIPFSSLTKAVIPFFQMARNGAGVMPMAGQDIILQWELAQPAAFLEVTGGPATGLTWQVQKMEIEYDECTIEGGPMTFVGKWFEMAGRCPQILFKSMWTNFYPLSIATEQDIQVDLKLQSIIAIMAVIRDGTNTQNPLILDKFETYLSKATTNLLEFQWEVNGVLWPDRPINLLDTNQVEAYVKYQDTFQMFHSRRVNEEVTPITAGAWATDKFVMCFDGNVHPFAMNMLSPISTSSGTSWIHLRLKFSAPPPPGLQIVFHALHHKIWNYNCSGATGAIVEN